MKELSGRQPKRYSVVISVRLTAASERGLQGEIIKMLRLSQRKTQSELAIALGIPRTTYVQIEKRGVVDSVQLFKLAKILGVGVEIFDTGAQIETAT